MSQITFLHAADIHLDSPLLSLQLQEQDQLDRMRHACRDSFERLVEFAIEKKVAFLLLAGDLYDHDAPNMQVVVFLRNQLLRLQKNGIRVFIAKGNHDANNKITSALALPGNTHIFSDRKAETIRIDDLAVSVSLHGQSFKPGPVTENLATTFPPAEKGRLNIGVLHTSLAGSLDHDPYAPCALSDLTNHAYQYWALGHIHKAAILSKDPWVVYPGNLQGRHAKESGPKGCVLVTAEDNVVISVEPIDLAVIRWTVLDIDTTNIDSEPKLLELLQTALSTASQEANDRPLAVRVRLIGETTLFDEIAQRPRRLMQTVLEIAGEVGTGDVWIEKIENDTHPPKGGPDTDSLNSAAAELGQIMEELAADPDLLRLPIQQLLEPLRAKLPEELKVIGALHISDSGIDLGTALRRVRPQLAARLVGKGEEP